MLQVTALTKRFGARCVFEHFSLSVPPNGFTILIGPSGCGKSTLFDVLTGISDRQAGRISWRGEPLPHLRGRAAYMQQNDLLLPWFSLLDNALLPARIARADPAAARRKARALFTRLGLAEVESYLPSMVSGGMRQRCALVRTLMFEHELVLLDEPLSALDAITRRYLQSLLLLLQSEFKRSLLMITHDIEEALLLADDLLVLTPAPMRVGDVYRLDLPKPRNISDPRLLGIKERVLDQLQEEFSGETV